MVYDYLISIKKRDYSVADQLSQLMYIFSILIFGYYYYLHPKNGFFYLVVVIGILLTWIYSFSKKRKKGEALFRLGLFICAIGWFLGPERNIWMAILYAAAGLIEKQVKFPAEIAFSKDEISVNSLPRKVMHWHEMKNVVIKDGLITIDQKNNKLTQKEIEGYVTNDIENEFNSFAAICISESNKIA